MNLKRISDWFLRKLYPPRCIFCSSVLSDGTTFKVCAKCLREVERIPGEHCPVCGRPSPLGSLICWDCSSNKRHYKSNRAVYFYKDKARRCVLRLKFRNKPHYAETMGKLMSVYVPMGFDFVTPVPLSQKRYKKRGYNQARLLAESVCENCGLECRDSLKKIKNNKEQSTLKFTKRQKNVRGVYEVCEDVKGKKILLVDDVCTTGATINECSRVLKKAGAESVDCITFAMVCRGDFK